MKIILTKNSLKNIFFYSLLFCIHIINEGCSTDEKPAVNKIVASIDNLPVYENDINALVNKKVEEMKRELLTSVVEEKVLMKEAKLRNMTVDSLLYLEVIKKAGSVTTADFNKYIKQYKINTKKKHAVDIIQLMKQIKKDEKRLEYITFLKQKYHVTVAWYPPSFTIVKPDSLLYYGLNPQQKNNISIYIITDPTNSLCLSIEPKLQSLLKNYGGQINFRYVISNENKTLSAINAANEQKKLIEMHSLIFGNNNIAKTEKDYLRYAEKLNLDMKKFKKDINKSQISKKQTPSMNELNDMDILTVPVFIVNNKLVNKNNSIDYLEAILQSEIQNPQ